MEAARSGLWAPDTKRILVNFSVQSYFKKRSDVCTTQFASHLGRVLGKTRLIFPRINGPNVTKLTTEEARRRREQGRHGRRRQMRD